MSCCCTYTYFNATIAIGILKRFPEAICCCLQTYSVDVVWLVMYNVCILGCVITSAQL